MTNNIKPGYYVRRQVGVGEGDLRAWELHNRLDAGEVIRVTSKSIRPAYIYYDLLGSHHSDIILSTRFNIYFRKPTQEEMVFIALSELDSEDSCLHGEEQ